VYFWDVTFPAWIGDACSVWVNISGVVASGVNYNLTVLTPGTAPLSGMYKVKYICIFIYTC
jgi:hypothetical protein